MKSLGVVVVIAIGFATRLSAMECEILTRSGGPRPTEISARSSAIRAWQDEAIEKYGELPFYSSRYKFTAKDALTCKKTERAMYICEVRMNPCTND
jgi:hypothetical protein